MVNDERANGRQLGKGVRPGRDVDAAAGELVAQGAQHVMAGMVAKSHQKRAEKNLALRARDETLGQGRRRPDEHVGAPRGR